MIDAHTHIFPPDTVRNRESYFDDDAFALLYRDNKSRMSDADSLAEYMHASGIESSFVYGFCWQNPDRCERHNDYILSNASDSYIPFASLPPQPSKHTDCLFKQITGNHFFGIGELAFYTSDITENTLDYLRDILQLAQRHNLVLSLHLNEPVGHDYPGKHTIPYQQLFNCITEYPSVDILLAHWGGGIFIYELMPEVKKVFRNVWYDSAASPFLYSPAIYRHAMEIVGEEKVLFGSDYPLLTAKRYLQDITESGLDEHSKEKLLHTNAGKLLKHHCKQRRIKQN